MATRKSNKEKIEYNKSVKNLNKYNNVFSDIIKDLDVSIHGSDLNRRLDLKRLGGDINKLAQTELDKMDINLSDRNFTKFLQNTYSRAGVTAGESALPEDIFQAENEQVLNYFNERYKSKYYLYDDIDLICQQIPELREAVGTTRDSVVNSDDMSQVISKKISFIGVNETQAEIAKREVLKIEKELKLDKKIKNIIVTNTIKYGEYYSYVVSYADIIQRYDYLNNNYNNSHINAMESVLFDDYDIDDIKYLSESAGLELISEVPIDESAINKTIIKKVSNENKKTQPQSNHNTQNNKNENCISKEEMLESVNYFLNKYSVYNDDLPLPIIESVSGVGELSGLFNTDKFKDNAKKSMNGKDSSSYRGHDTFSTADGTVDYSSLKGRRSNNASNVKGVYIKFINPKFLIPIRIMDDIVIGYYWIREKPENTRTNPSSTIGLNNSFMSNLLSDNQNKNLEKEMVTKIVEKIVKAFDKKYLEDNNEFKELIISALMFNDTYRKNISFQFISPEYIVHHTIDETETGNGVSILKDSLFNAKLYLGLLLFKMLSIISKSNDTRIYTVQNSIDNQDISNNVQRVIREIKGNQMSYLDLMNYNSLVSKLGANKSIFMQSGVNGTPPITYDILAGQQIELHTELMEMLKNSAINATGVPSVLMNNINEVDFAKQLELLNIKFADRAANLQLDFNPSITELYQKILRNATTLDDNVISSLQYTLNPPKASNIINAVEQASNSDSIINYMIEKKYEGNTSFDEETLNAVKSKKILELAKFYNPNLPWDILDDDTEAEISVKIDNYKTKITGDDGSEE